MKKRLPEAVSEKNVNRKKKKRGRLSVKQKVWMSVILVLYAIVLAATSFVVFYRPKVENNTTVFIETILDSDGNVVEVEHTYTRQQDKYNILILGHDRAAMLTDVFMLINIDCSTNGITVMQIPRDTWISNPDGVYVTTNKINALFSTYYNYHYRYGDVDSSSEAYSMALQSVAEVLEDSLCIEIDYSAIMDLDGFVNIVDILGGVTIEVPFTMTYYDPEQNLYINIPAGLQTLDGAQSEGFVRYRSGYTTADMGRQDAQKRFMIALFDKVKGSVSLSNAGMLTEMADEIFSNLDTDMSAANVLFFGKEVLKTDLANITMMTMPGNLANSYYVMNRAAVLQVMNSSYNVHDKDITDGIFDSSRLFNNSSYSSMNEAYYADADKTYNESVYTGEEIDDITIPSR